MLNVCAMRMGFLLWLFVSIQVVAGCSARDSKVASAVGALPEYSARDSASFGDSVGAKALGYLPEVDPGADPRMRDRASTADFVSPVQVATLTEESVDEENQLVVSVVALEPSLAGTEDPRGTMDLRISKRNPARLRLRALGKSFVRRRLLLFGKRFAENGEPVMHWHLDSDDPALRVLVNRVKTLDAAQRAAQTAK